MGPRDCAGQAEKLLHAIQQQVASGGPWLPCSRAGCLKYHANVSRLRSWGKECEKDSKMMRKGSEKGT